MKLLIFTLSILIPLLSVAMDNCDQTVPLTCSPGELDDGTAQMRRSRAVNNQQAEILRNLETRTFQSFVAKLRPGSETSDWDLQLALSTTGVAARQECEGVRSVATISQDCANLVATGLTDRVLIEVSQGQRRNSEEGLEEEYMLNQSELFQSVLTSSQDHFETLTGTPATESRIRQELFPQIRNYVIQTIDRFVTDERQREILRTKIRGVNFGGMDCESVTGGGLSEAFSPNAFYDTASNKVYFCKGNDRLGLSAFAAIHALAHEIGHAVDPCNVQQGPAMFSFQYSSQDPAQATNEYPFTNLIQCLRDSRSIGARTIEAEDNYPEGYRQGRRAGRGSSNDGGQGASVFCEDDQITESFCDWMATEVLALYSQNDPLFKGLTQQQYKYGVSNIWRGFCSPGSGLANEGGVGVHPGSRDRLTQLILPHPTIRSRLSCRPLNENSSIYCNPRTYQPVIQENMDEEEMIPGSQEETAQ